MINKSIVVLENATLEVTATITETGPRGLQGEQGPKGDKGDQGIQGERGIQGPKGDKGDDGYTPIKGVDYFDGKDGEQGPKGDKGDRGEKGDKGDTGAQGIQGIQGEQGPKGDKGDKGDTGEIENLTGEMVTDALGYIPLSEDSLPDNLETTSGSQAKANAAESNAKDYVDGKVKTDVPVGAKFTDTVYTHPASHPASMITGLPTSLPADGGNADTVGGFTVGINVPANAKFTDTVTTINGKTGTITKADITALGIPAQDTVVDISGKADITYVDSKVQTDVPSGAKFTDTVTTINGNTGAISKADIVALGVPAQDTVPTKANVETALGYKVVFYNDGDTIPTLPADTIAFIKEV